MHNADIYGGWYSQGSRKRANQASIRNSSFGERELIQDGRQGGSKSTGRISKSLWMNLSLAGGKCWNLTQGSLGEKFSDNLLPRDAAAASCCILLKDALGTKPCLNLHCFTRPCSDNFQRNNHTERVTGRREASPQAGFCSGHTFFAG